MEYKKDRDVYIHHTSKVKGDGFLQSRIQNKLSLDALPGLDIPNPDVYVIPETQPRLSANTSAAPLPKGAAAAGGLEKRPAAAVVATQCRSQAAKGKQHASGLVGFTSIQAALPTLLMLVFAWCCGAIMAKAV